MKYRILKCRPSTNRWDYKVQKKTALGWKDITKLAGVDGAHEVRTFIDEHHAKQFVLSLVLEPSPENPTWEVV